MAFLIHIRPFLAQGYDDDDTSQYIINLMPKALRESGRRIKTELIAEGHYRDHMYVIQTCRALVQEECKGPAKTPAFVVVAVADVGNLDLASLSRSTGMDLTFDGSSGPSGPADFPTTGLVGFDGKDGKWCPKCPHPRGMQCFEDPAYSGPMPINVFKNKERLKGILAAKAANAAKAGVLTRA